MSVQGFYVEATTSGTITFKESHRVSGSNDDNSFYRQANTIDFSRFKLAVSSNEFYGETLLAFRSEATNGIDRMYDAKMFESRKSLQVYSLIDKEAFAIQSLPSIDQSMTIPLGVQVEFDGQYEISLRSFENMPEGYMVRLIDNETNLVYDLAQPVSLSLASGRYEGRFTVNVSSAPLNIPNLKNENLKVYSQDGLAKVWISGRNDSEKVLIETFDMKGQRVHSIIAQMTDGLWEGSLSAANGILFMMVTTPDGEVYANKFFSK